MLQVFCWYRMVLKVNEPSGLEAVEDGIRSFVTFRWCSGQETREINELKMRIVNRKNPGV